MFLILWCIGLLVWPSIWWFMQDFMTLIVGNITSPSQQQPSQQPHSWKLTDQTSPGPHNSLSQQPPLQNTTRFAKKDILWNQLPEKLVGYCCGTIVNVSEKRVHFPWQCCIVLECHYAGIHRRSVNSNFVFSHWSNSMYYLFWDMLQS